MSAAEKHDGEKPRFDLLPPEALALVSQILTFGAKKYSPWNWARGLDWSRLYAAAQRHMNAFWGGEDNDPETGLPHLGHALCCLLFLTVHQVRGLGKDDRPTYAKSST